MFQLENFLTFMSVVCNKSNKISKHCFCETSVIWLKLLRGTHLPSYPLLSWGEWVLTATTNVPLPILTLLFACTLRIHMPFYHRISLYGDFALSTRMRHDIREQALDLGRFIWRLPVKSLTTLPLVFQKITVKPILKYFIWVDNYAIKLISRSPTRS